MDTHSQKQEQQLITNPMIITINIMVIQNNSITMMIVKNNKMN